MAKKKKVRRTRSPHPGVIVVKRKRSGGTSWRARWTDPETLRKVWYTLDPEALPDDDARTAWAKERAKSLAVRRAEIASGAPRRTRTAFSVAVDEYLAAGRNRLRPATVDAYARSLETFTTWAAKNGIGTVEALSPAHLAGFRHHLAAQPLQHPARGARRGAKVETSRRKSPFFVNHDLRGVGAFLMEARRLGRTPLLSKDGIGDGLRSFPTPRLLPRPLGSKDVRAVLLAALAHDAEKFRITRKEHAENPSAEALYRTPRYAPVAPLVAFVVLSGCRIGEALDLSWKDVALDAPGEDGAPAGEVRLQATATKTAHERVIDLSVSPALRALLGRLRLRAGRAPFVFGGEEPLCRDDAENGRKRTIRKYGAPSYSWQVLRQTTASYLVNAKRIFYAASIYRSAAQLGHSASVAQRHYLGVIKGIPPDARTVEDAMGIADLLPRIACVEEASSIAG